LLRLANKYVYTVSVIKTMGGGAQCLNFSTVDTGAGGGGECSASSAPATTRAAADDTIA